MGEPDAKYTEAERVSNEFTEAIVRSSSKKKVVVAGPGTGKTHLFKEVLEGKANALTLTFVNALVEDLSLELYGLSDVKTLHSYARSLLSRFLGDVKVFPKLSQVIREDALILTGKDIDFDKIFHNKEDDNKQIEFYKARKNYYDKYYGYSDVVYALVKFIEKYKDKIPAYEQILVDEFQDFNKLEISLIDLLSEQSPVLLAGDDDQALYEELKSASAEHIRNRYDEKDKQFESFTLPFCRRSTRVIVEATNDVIKSAMDNGCLAGRIDKKYVYFDHKQKDIESAKNPKIISSHQFANKIPWFIEKQIKEIARDVRDKFSVLVISPTNTQLQSIVEALKGKGFANIQYAERRSSDSLSLLDGLKILLEEKDSNLGWRIVVGSILPAGDFKKVLQKTAQARPKKVVDLIHPTEKRKINEMLTKLRAIRDNRTVDKQELGPFLESVGLDHIGMASELLRDEITPASRMAGDPALRRIPIKVTTIQSSKGLSADYVFITYFDDAYFIKNKDKKKISDNDVRSFLVALTRAKRRVILISSSNNDPTFLNWIDSARIQRV